MLVFGADIEVLLKLEQLFSSKAYGVSAILATSVPTHSLTYLFTYWPTHKEEGGELTALFSEEAKSNDFRQRTSTDEIHKNDTRWRQRLTYITHHLTQINEVLHTRLFSKPNPI